jgi:aminopeptidase YwaD
MADAADAGAFARGYREAIVAINHQAAVEKKVIESAGVLWTNASVRAQKTAPLQPLIDQRAAALVAEINAVYQIQAAQRGVPATIPAMTAAEREAANLVVQRVEAPAGQGGRGRGAGPGAAQGGPPPPSLPQEMNAEFNQLLPKGMTALEIRDFLSGEFTPLPLEDLMAVLRARERAGAITLVPKK